MKESQNIQGFLAVGYVFLIVMGIFNESIYYNQIGVDILNYSSVMDVLISPIAIITSKTTTLIVFSVLVVLTYSLPAYLSKREGGNWLQKQFKVDTDLGQKELESTYLVLFSFLFAIGLFGFFVGTGIGQGTKITKKIAAKEIQYNDRLNFMDGTVDSVAIVGKNSSYIFYLVDGNKTVRITPISGILKSIDEVKDKRKDKPK